MKGLKINIKAAQCIKDIPISRNEINNIKNTNDRYIISKILENIFISCYRLANDVNILKSNKITHVINCAYGSDFIQKIKIDEIKYLNLYLKDEPGYDFFYEIFSSINFIENALKNQGNILIHCHEVKK